MALTVTIHRQDHLGNKRLHIVGLTFDSSYPTGGESLTARNCGLSTIDHIQLEPASGLSFEYDHTNSKVKVYQKIPPIIFEELVTVTDNVGTLRYPGAFIMSVSYGNTHYHPIPGGLVPATGQVAISNYTSTFTPGPTTLTFLAGDSVTACIVTYATQAWRELVDNYVFCQITAGARVYGHADAVFVAGTPDRINLGEVALAIGSILWNDAGVYKEVDPIIKGATAATKEAAIDWTHASYTNFTVLEMLQTDTWDAATDTAYVVYIRKPSTGFLADRWLEEDDLTPSSDVVTLSPGGAPGILQPILWGTAGGIPGPTLKFANLISSSEAVGTTATLIQPTLFFPGVITAATFTLGSNHADTDHLKPTYVWGFPWEIATVPCEICNGQNLSALSDVRAMVIGS